jgi:hypothetical protein
MANPVTFRMWVPNRQGRADLHFRDPDIHPSSVVHIAVSEATARGESQNIFGSGPSNQDWGANFGDAAITLQNVSVGEGVVDFRVFVDWDGPLNLVTDITIFDPAAQIVIGT